MRPVATKLEVPSTIPLIFSLFLLMSCESRATDPAIFASSKLKSGDDRVAVASTPDEFELSPEQLDLLSKKGLAGDPDAAYSVYLHYALGWTSHSSSAEQERWLAYSTENGDERAWLLQANRLLNNPSDSSCRRAAFWYKKLLNSKAAEMAASAREEISASKKNWPKFASIPICADLSEL